MKRCVVYMNNHDGFINLEADRMTESDEFFIVLNGKEIVGVFDKGCILAIYLSEKKVA